MDPVMTNNSCLKCFPARGGRAAAKRQDSPAAISLAVDRFCRLQCAWGPAERECLDCFLLDFRRLNETERLLLFGLPGEREA